jgi:hypothetical protein
MTARQMKRGHMYRVEVRYLAQEGYLLREFRGVFVGIDDQSQFPEFDLRPLAKRLVIPWDWFVDVEEAEYRYGPMMPRAKETV